MLLFRVLLSSSFALTAIASPEKDTKALEDAKARLNESSPDVINELALFVSSVEMSQGLTCYSCQSFLKTLKKFSNTNTAFVASGRQVCSVIRPLLNNQLRTVCLEGVAEHGPLLAEVLRSIPDVENSTAATLLCNNFLQVCEVATIKSKIDLPPLPTKLSKPKSSDGEGSYKVIHFSDLHIDPLYKIGAIGDCSNPFLCCRNASDHTKSPAGEFGYPKKCDTSYGLEKSMYRATKELAGDANYTIFTGDIVDREFWHTSPETNAKTLHEAYDRMKKVFPHFYPAVGNHESSPANSFPLAAESSKKFEIKWLYGLLSSLWQGTQVGQVESNHYRGRYAYRDTQRGVRVIGINTNLYYYLNLWLYMEPMSPDPDGQLKWLVEELAAAEQMGEKVWIIGHMPMGDVDVMRHSSNMFNQITSRFSQTISAMFFGHTHLDQYQISYKDGGKQTAENASVISFIAPSITPSDGNPAFRVYKVGKVSHSVLDATTYFTDMSDPWYRRGPKWKSLYSIKSIFPQAFKPNINAVGDMSSVPISAERWHKLTEMWEQDNKLFGMYWKNKVTGTEPKYCNAECRKKEICLVRGGRAEDNCAGMKPGVKLGDGGRQRQLERRTENEGSNSGAHEQVNHCGGSSLILNALGVLFDPDLQAKLRQVVWQA
ncbi:hypothetical protein E4U32_002673 [Claviceps aff. humidiphila group G2b]|nr:hypothetical protein E4U32_002673 [Claviceps aff. humidiphila group G2b]